jgi:hypothetical protein
MPEEYGPFQAERDAWATEACAAERAAWKAPGDGEKFNMQMLVSACEETGIELGAYDLSPLRQVAMYETSKCVALRGIIRRAYEAGKAAGPDGAVTEWGLRYQDDDGYDVTMPYPEDEVRQILRECGDPSPSVRRTVVVRQVGLWTPARLAEVPACRHCGGELVRCDPPHDMPACLGWKHAALLSRGPVGPHYCEGRSVNPSGEPGEEGS